MSDAIEGINLPVIGLILMIVGVIGLAISLLWASAWSRGRRGGTAVDDRPVVRERDVY